MSSLDNHTVGSGSLSYQRCLIPNIPEKARHTIRDVINFVLIPLSMLLAFLSIISNSLVLTAVIRVKSLQHPSLLLLCSLSITDLLWAVLSIVTNLLRFSYEDFCPAEGEGEFGAGFVVLCYLSTLGNLAIISRDRYLAVSKPWWYRNHMTRSYVIKHSSAIWLLSFVMSGMIYTSHFYPVLGMPLNLAMPLFYVISIAVIISSYVGIFIANRRHNRTMHHYGHQELATLKREKKLANTVVLILIIFCVTFLPGLITPLVLIILGFSTTELIPYNPFYYFLITLNGFLNPLLNCGRHEGVRRAVRGKIRCSQSMATGRVDPHNKVSEEDHNDPPSITKNAEIEVPSYLTHN